MLLDFGDEKKSESLTTFTKPQIADAHILFHNASSAMIHVDFWTVHSEDHVFVVDEKSKTKLVDIRFCMKHSCPQHTLFLSNGFVWASNLSFVSFDCRCSIPSIVSSAPGFESQNEGKTVLECSAISLHVISTTCPFVNDCGTSFVSLEDCHFFNVTQQKRVKTVSLSNTKAIVDSCDFSDMTTPYYGCIVSGLLSTGGFAVFNTSFRKCSYSKTVVNTVTTNGTEPVFFSDTYFSCKSENHGGAIYHRINYPMTIERCMFFECNSSQSGGAIGTDNAPALSALIINNTIGEKCFAALFGAFMMSDYQKNMQMRNTNISDSYGNNCGGVYLNRYPGNILIVRCYFNNCSDEGDRILLSSGGILIGDGHNVSISDCSLTKCSGLTAGGICFWGDKDWGGDYTGVVMFCFFEENSARNGGKDVSVMGKWVENADQSMLIECRSKTLGSNRVMHGESDVSEWIPYYYSGALFVNSETGDDNEACGKNERKCRTVGYIPVLVDPQKAESTRVVIESPRIVEHGCNVANKKIEILWMGI
eukprot:MONOS_7883.1-p1 / transcript=MONOS_7883.1 / gene=MONOS_7883 / organism=Monocercomonoides_exilis_PA203 / gene_product=unspecified product / transcript_product=unspecified product / location=Mono_scaffold00282:33-1764(-) / protein_length=534 / sequence_SO=supercontig / SO=protein_coding / is_pseudo=false